MSQDRLTTRERKLTACLYAKHGAARHLRKTGELPPRVGGPWSVIALQHVIEERGIDPILTDDEMLIFEALRDSPCTGAVRLLPEHRMDKEHQTSAPLPKSRAPMSTLERAIAIAVEAHAGQHDKAGAPYILHPLRVMFAVKTEPERIAAVLHDVVEDTNWTLEELRAEGFADAVIDAIDALTRRSGEDYFDFVARAKTNAIATQVKIADLRDNLNVDRLPKLSDSGQERLARYKRALEMLHSN